MFGDISFKPPGLYNLNKTSSTLVTIAGDISGSGTPPSTITLTLPTVNANVGTFQGLTVNAKGQVTGAVNQSYLTANQTITVSGDISGSGTTSITGTLATVNSNVGTFQGLTINGKGLITAAVNQNYLTSVVDTVAYSYAGGL